MKHIFRCEFQINFVYLIVLIFTFIGSDAISPLNLLNILLISSNNFGASNLIQTNPIFQQNNPFLPQSNQISQPAQSMANILLTSLTGVYKTDGLLQNSLNRGGLSLKKIQNKNVKLVFDQGMDKLRSDKTLYKYVKKIRNPFNAQGEVRINQNQIKQQLKSRKIPCRKLAKVSKTKKAKQICREIKRRRLAARRKVKKKLQTRRKKP